MTALVANPLTDDVAARFAPEGPLAMAWPGFEERPGQRALAAAIAETLERGGVLMAEAPTGLGKSLAYLVPALLLAARTNVRVVVATCTRSLQDQLFERDLPAVAAALGVDVPCVRLKGKQNYLCTRSLDMAHATGDEEQEALDELKRWAAEDAEGDLDRFPAPDAEAFQRVRPRVATDPDACTMLTCRRGRECCWVRARRLAGEARLLVVNHALLARAAEAEGLLPEYDVLVIDEAHRLEEMLLAQVERGVSRHRFEELLRLLGSPGGRRRNAGLLGRVRSFALPLAREGGQGLDDVLESIAQRIPECREAVDRLFDILEPANTARTSYGIRVRHHSTEGLMGGDLEPLEHVVEACAGFGGSLRQAADHLAGGSSAAVELSAELEQVSGRWTALGHELLDICEASRRDWVYWRAATSGGVQLKASPITAGELARRLVIDRARATVLTSATLTAGGDFGFTAQRLGLGDPSGGDYATSLQPSPFELERQMRAYVLDPGGQREAEAVSGAVVELARHTRRNQLVLFTAHERLRRARELLLATLPPEATLFAQEWDGSVSRVTEKFRAARGAILLGVQSLWEGVDFPGAELEIVVVAKLPFSVPDEPRVEARGELLRDQGRDPFRDDAVPEAVLRFRQGIGRLIRRRDDRGALVVCDPRLATASYRRPFLEALPSAPRRFAEPRTLAVDVAAFLDQGQGEEIA